jgi:hypothetical protein
MTWGQFNSFHQFPSLGGGLQPNYLQQATQLGLQTSSMLNNPMGFGSGFGNSLGGNSFGAGFGTGLSSGSGLGGMQQHPMSMMSTSMITNSGMDPNSQLNWIDAKYGHLFNLGLQLNPQQVLPKLWQAQATAVNQYMDQRLAMQQQAANGNQEQGSGGLMGWLEKNKTLVAIGLPILLSLFKGEKLDLGKIAGSLLGGGQAATEE